MIGAADVPTRFTLMAALDVYAPFARMMRSPAFAPLMADCSPERLLTLMVAAEAKLATASARAALAARRRGRVGIMGNGQSVHHASDAAESGGRVIPISRPTFTKS